MRCLLKRRGVGYRTSKGECWTERLVIYVEEKGGEVEVGETDFVVERCGRVMSRGERCAVG